MPINLVLQAAQQRGNKLFLRRFDVSIIPTKEVVNQLDAMEDIVMIGYPNGLWDSVNNMPIIRRGITATSYRLDYEGRKEFMIDAACFPGSSGSPILICNQGSYRTKGGVIQFGNSRILFLGVLYAGPQLTVQGDIKIVTVPDVNQKAMTISHIPNNLGYVIKSQRILDFIPLLRSLIK